MNTTSTVGKTWYEQLWEDYSYHGTALLLLYMLYGALTNSVVLVVFGKDKKLTGRDFILCLAIIDIIGCLFLLPQTPILLIHSQFDSLQTFGIIYGIESVVIIQSYLFAQVAMALDQFVAVYFPFKHRRFGPKLKKIMLVAAVSTVASLSALSLLKNATNVDSFAFLYFLYFVAYRLVIILSFLTLLVVYPLIVVKLYRQHHKIRAKAAVGTSVISSAIQKGRQRTTAARLPTTTELHVTQDEAGHRPIEAETALTETAERGKNYLATTSAESGTCTPIAAEPDTGREPSTNVTNLTRQPHNRAQAKGARKMHVQAIKVYSSIFLLFALSLVSLLVLIQLRIGILAYVYSLNHTGNPIIYYVFVPKFRETVNAYCKNLKCW